VTVGNLYTCILQVTFIVSGDVVLNEGQGLGTSEILRLPEEVKMIVGCVLTFTVDHALLFSDADENNQADINDIALNFRSARQ
jgi:hypothetical protein